MLTDTIADPEGTSADEVYEEYAAALAAIVDERGAAAVAAETDLDEERAAAIGAGSATDITVEEAAAVLALTDDWPDAETVVLELRDHVMLEMSSAVVDVDKLADGIEGDLDPKEVQQKIEGRHPMTLREYAEIHRFLADENPW